MQKKVASYSYVKFQILKKQLQLATSQQLLMNVDMYNTYTCMYAYMHMYMHCTMHSVCSTIPVIQLSQQLLASQLQEHEVSDLEKSSQLSLCVATSHSYVKFLFVKKVASYSYVKFPFLKKVASYSYVKFPFMKKGASYSYVKLRMLKMQLAIAT